MNTLGVNNKPIGNNACSSTGTNNLNIHSVKVTPTPTSGCTPGGNYAPTGSARLTTPQTICCAQ
jgi:hypothetical protein